MTIGKVSAMAAENNASEQDGPIAQLRLERTPDKREVSGSTPLRPTKRLPLGEKKISESVMGL